MLGVYWDMLRVYWNMLGYTGICWGILEYAGVYWDILGIRRYTRGILKVYRGMVGTYWGVY